MKFMNSVSKTLALMLLVPSLNVTASELESAIELGWTLGVFSPRAAKYLS